MGAQVLTYYTLFQMWKHGKSAAGGARLTKYVAQDGAASAVRVCYAGRRGELVRCGRAG